MRILLVEDSSVDARVVQELVRAAAPDARVEVAPTLAAAQALVADRTYDAALVDLILPDADGLDALAALRDKAPDLPLVVLTGRADEENAIEAVRQGAQDYLVKGSGAPALLRAIRYAIERQRRMSVSAPVLRDLRRHLDLLEAEHRTLRRLVEPERSTPSERTDKVGDRYRLLRRLGAGSSGEAWLATDETLGREVCVKLLHARPTDAAAAQRFAQEARVAASLEHPNIVRIYDFGGAQGRLYLVMEHVPGGSLADRLAREGALAPRDAAAVLRDILDGLDHVHAHGLLHRDLKPANVLLGRSSAKLCDFGLAHSRMMKAAPDATQDGLAAPPVLGAGTPAYMSPEAALGVPLDERSDLYGAGAILYHLLAGRPYLDLVGLDSASARRAILDAEPEPRKGPLFDVALAALAKDPAERPPSARELRRALDDALERHRG